jgi:hypothetical protein
VAFVSLTDLPRGGAERFAREFSAPWPCGYGAAPESVARWGAYNPGREVSPTLYLVGPGGLVLWCDGRGRLRHVPGPEREAELEAAIERALAGEPQEAAGEVRHRAGG